MWSFGCPRSAIAGLLLHCIGLGKPVHRHAQLRLWHGKKRVPVVDDMVTSVQPVSCIDINNLSSNMLKSVAQRRNRSLQAMKFFIHGL